MDVETRVAGLVLGRIQLSMNLGLEMRLPPGFHYARGGEAVWRDGVEALWNQRGKVENCCDCGEPGGPVASL